MIRNYEMMYILNPRLDEESQKSLQNRIKETIGSIGGTVDNTENLGRKRLAYPIQKSNDGVYVLSHFKADSRQLKELTRVMNISEGLLRHIVIRRDEE